MRVFRYSPLLLFLSFFSSLPPLSADVAPSSSTVSFSSAPVSERERLAEAYGFSSWPLVRTLRYTYNEESGGKTIKRRWEWDVVKEAITYTGPDLDGKEITKTYKREKLADSANPKLMETIDRAYINDHYWLVFPFHLMWDRDVSFTEEPDVRRLVVVYGNVGYTPGDVYELYYNADYRLTHWIYRRGGSPDGKEMTWTGYEKIGPLLFSTRHESPDGKSRIYFTDVSVQLKFRE